MRYGLARIIAAAAAAAGLIAGSLPAQAQAPPPADYPSAVLAAGPAGYWRLSDPVGSPTAADSSGNSQTGSVVGNVTFGQPGALPGSNTAALFDGSSSGVYLPGFTRTLPATVEMWVKPASGWGGGGWAFAHEGFQVGIGGGWCTGLEVVLWDGAQDACTGFTATAGAWYHLTVVMTASGRQLYVNGGLVYADSVAPPAAVTSAAAIGVHNGGHGWTHFAGAIDEVAYFGTALSASQIAGIYAASASTPSGTFDSGSGSGTGNQTNTPELGSLALFGSGMTGLAGYVWTRVRGVRRKKVDA